MSNYPANSHKAKAERAAAEEKKVEKVVKGTAKTKKRSGMKKAADVFISEDVSSVKSYVILDVIVPAIKKAMYDVVVNGIDMFLYGGTGGGAKKKSGSHISYGSYFDNRGGGSGRTVAAKTSSRFDYDDIVFETRGEAEAVRMQMEEVIELYTVVTVADMYDMAGLTPPYTGQRYGWTNIRAAETRRVRDGYILSLPKAMPID